jgi:hemolysin III
MKPLLRGWFHAIASVGAIAVTIGLLVKTYGDLPRCLSVLIFGLSMIALYVVSSIYHLGTWQGSKGTALRALDHANIYLLIAGTYTPICVNVLTGQLRTTILVLIWSIAAVGIGCVMFTLRLPRWITALLYIGMGWIGLISLPSLLHAFPLPALLSLFTGGILYSIGALVYILRRPNPLPHIFGFHEIFHLFVIGGSMIFVAVIWIWVVPFPRS